MLLVCVCKCVYIYVSCAFSLIFLCLIVCFLLLRLLVLFYLIFFLFLSFLDAWLFPKKRTRMCIDLDRWGSRNNLVGAGEVEGIYSMKKNLFSTRKKKGIEKIVLSLVISSYTLQYIYLGTIFIHSWKYSFWQIIRIPKGCCDGYHLSISSSILSVLVASHEYLN